MTKEEQEKFITEYFIRMDEILLSKGDDYANSDRLSNFKLSGAIVGISPEQNCLSLIATKVARIGVLLKSKNPKNESIDDSVIDLANYTILLAMLLKESHSCGMPRSS